MTRTLLAIPLAFAFGLVLHVSPKPALTPALHLQPLVHQVGACVDMTVHPRLWRRA